MLKVNLIPHKTLNLHYSLPLSIPLSQPDSLHGLFLNDFWGMMQRSSPEIRQQTGLWFSWDVRIFPNFLQQIQSVMMGKMKRKF